MAIGGWQLAITNSGFLLSAISEIACCLEPKL